MAEEEENKELIAKESVRKVSKSALGISRIVGTPQTARFAAMNLSNESLWLSLDSAGTVSGSQLTLNAKIIHPGDQKEIVIPIERGNTGYEISIETDIIQSDLQAQEVANMISRSFDKKFDLIDIEIFGNPLLEIGDIVHFNYKNREIYSSENEYYIITGIKHSFSEGLKTNLIIKPLVLTNPVSANDE